MGSCCAHSSHATHATPRPYARQQRQQGMRNRVKGCAGFEFEQGRRNNNSLFCPKKRCSELPPPSKPTESPAATETCRKRCTRHYKAGDITNKWRLSTNIASQVADRSHQGRQNPSLLVVVDGHHPHERKQKAEGDCVSGAPIKDCRYFRAKLFLSPAPLRP